MGDAFGVDRMDYLLRDSHHAGVAYGKFDHFRLVDTLCILQDEDERASDFTAPTLGIEEGGLQAAESLLWARYFMYTQLYFHHVRRIYDIHLKDFLKSWLPGGRFSTDLEQHLCWTDNEVTTAISQSARDGSTLSHDPARRIVNREHFRLLYQRNPDDVEKYLEPGRCVYDAAVKEFGQDAVRRDSYHGKSQGMNFPVYTRDEKIASSITLSETLRKVPKFAIDFVFINPSIKNKAIRWLQENRETILNTKQEAE